MARFISRPRIETRATLELEHDEILALHSLTRFGIEKVREYLDQHFTGEYDPNKGLHGKGMKSFLESIAQLGPIITVHSDLSSVAAGTHIVTRKPEAGK